MTQIYLIIGHFDYISYSFEKIET